MESAASKRSLEFSQWLYGRLLAAYPRRHREEFGGAMAQLFRDQCRDAWAAGRNRGLALLWCRTLPDLVRTSLLERLTYLNPGKFMADKMNALLSPRKSPAAVFFTVFTVVFLLVTGVVTVITFILPESYASTCRIKVEPDAMNFSSLKAAETNNIWFSDPFFLQSTFEIIQSQMVLSNVVNQLNLNEGWGKKFFGREKLKTVETMELLKRRLDLKPVRNTSLIEITVYSDDRKECARIANAVAKAYGDYRVNVRRQVIAGVLDTMLEQYQSQDEQIGQLQTEVGTLSEKYGMPDNPMVESDLLEKSKGQLLEQQRVVTGLVSQLSQLQALDKSRLREALPTVAPDSVLTELLGKLDAARQSYASLTNDYAPADMHILRVVSTMEELNREIDARATGILVGLEDQVASKQAVLAALQGEIADMEQKSKPTAENQPYWDKKRALDQLLDTHKTLAAKIETDKLNLNFMVAPVQMTDAAEPAQYPVKPNKPLNIVIGVILGLFLGGVSGTVVVLVTGKLRR